MATEPGLSFSELIAPQGRGRGAYSTGTQGSLLSYQLYSPTVVEPSPPLVGEIIIPIPTWKIPFNGHTSAGVIEGKPGENMQQFAPPSTTILYGDGSNSAVWNVLPIPTRLRSKQVTIRGVGSNDDFLIYDGSFELVLGYIGTMEILLEAEGYEPQYTVFTAVEPEIVEV